MLSDHGGSGVCGGGGMYVVVMYGDGGVCGGVYGGSGVGELLSIISYSLCFKRLEMPYLMFCMVNSS